MYAKVDSNGDVVTFPYTIKALKQEYPNTSFPAEVTNATLAGFNVVPVTVADKPAHNEVTQRVVQQATPTRVGSDYILNWDIVARSAEDQAIIQKSKLRDTFETAKRVARTFDEQEVETLLAGYLEVKLVRLAILLGQNAASVDTPVIDAFNAVFPGQTKLQIAQTIENRAQTYLTATATALANKIKNGG